MDVAGWWARWLGMPAALKLSAWRSRRGLRRTPVIRIADLAENQLACIAGRVEYAGELVRAPITDQPCVAFVATLLPARRQGPITVFREFLPFEVVDDSGRARVDGAAAVLCCKPVPGDDHYVVSGRYEVRTIRVGDRVRLIGSVVVQPVAADAAGERGYREGTTRATLTASFKHPLVIDLEGS